MSVMTWTSVSIRHLLLRSLCSPIQSQFSVCVLMISYWAYVMGPGLSDFQLPFFIVKFQKVMLQNQCLKHLWQSWFVCAPPATGVMKNPGLVGDRMELGVEGWLLKNFYLNLSSICFNISDHECILCSMLVIPISSHSGFGPFYSQLQSRQWSLGPCSLMLQIRNANGREHTLKWGLFLRVHNLLQWVSLCWMKHHEMRIH